MQITDLRPTESRRLKLEDFADLGARVVRSGSEVGSVSLDSHDIVAGDLFVAVPGKRHHGASFAAAACTGGAVAVATDAAGVARLVNDPDWLRQFPQIGIVEVDDPRRFAGLAAARVWGNPAQDLLSIGVSGTNGKTTTTHFIYQSLRVQGRHPLLIGTAGITLGRVHVESVRTSVEAPVLHRLLAWARQNGADCVVMEVSSHALALHRVAGIRFDVAAFLNLQRDHLDFHHTMESYFDAKAELYSPLLAKYAVICVDDQWGRRLAGQVQIPTVTVSTRREVEADCQVRSIHTCPTGTGTVSLVVDGEGQFDLACPLPGEINVQNALVAHACLTACGVGRLAAAESIGSCPQVPGRMEVVSERSEVSPLVVVDFAHTPDAMSAACRTLDRVTEGKLWCVFGATGQRDRGKRPLMGAAVAACADVIVLTDDDVYDEDAAAIRRDVAAGFGLGQSEAGGSQQSALQGLRAKLIFEDDDRAHAIAFAVQAASVQDTVLLAGRGHETVQMVGRRAVALDDRVQARAALERGGSAELAELVRQHLLVGHNRTAQLLPTPKTWEDYRNTDIQDPGEDQLKDADR